MRRFFHLTAILPVCLVLSGCALELGWFASDASDRLVGKTNEQILGCMGEPARRSVDGGKETWIYNAADQRATDPASAPLCQVNVELRAGKVFAVTYQAPAGGLLARDQQCARVMTSCMQKKF